MLSIEMYANINIDVSTPFDGPNLLPYYLRIIPFLDFLVSSSQRIFTLD
jgi:hypothetical protein